MNFIFEYGPEIILPFRSLSYLRSVVIDVIDCIVFISELFINEPFDIDTMIFGLFVFLFISFTPGWFLKSTVDYRSN